MCIWVVLMGKLHSAAVGWSTSPNSPCLQVLLQMTIKNYQGHEVSPSLRARELACHCFMDASWWSMQSMCVRWFGTKSSQCLAHKRCRNGRDPGELSPSNNTAMPHSGINRVVPTPLNKQSEQYIYLWILKFEKWFEHSKNINHFKRHLQIDCITRCS